MALAIIGSKQTAVVKTDYAIRSLFASNHEASLCVTRSDGNVTSAMTLLPSSFFVIENQQEQTGEVETITFLGGGYGHGVGLSQNGAKGMADQGDTYKEILFHFYPGIELVSMWQ